MKKRFSFIGAGNMATAIIEGIGMPVCVYDKNTAQYDKFEGKGHTVASDIPEAVANGDYIFLCVKPQNFDEILPVIAACDLKGKMIISIAAGITIERIEKALGDTPIIRVMPNTPMMIGKGVIGLCRNARVGDKVFSEICRLFSTRGEVVVLDESKINALIAGISSAPAYVFLFIKSIAEKAAELGIDDPRMLDYVTRMTIGSAELLLSTKKTPDELIRMVTSPKGTTAEAMRVFEERDFAGIIAEAMDACKERADELAN